MTIAVPTSEVVRILSKVFMIRDEVEPGIDAISKALAQNEFVAKVIEDVTKLLQADDSEGAIITTLLEFLAVGCIAGVLAHAQTLPESKEIN